MTRPLALLVVAAIGCGPSTEQVERTRASAQALLDEADRRDEAFRSAAREALARPASGTCDRSVLDLDTHDRPENYVEHRLDDLDTARMSHTKKVSDDIRGDIRFIDRHVSGEVDLDTDAFDRMERGHRVTREQELATRHEVILVARSFVEPELHGASYTPGSIDARVFVWDVEAERIQCSADVRVVSESSVVVSEGYEQGSLTGNLVHRTREQAFAALGLGELGSMGLGARAGGF